MVKVSFAKGDFRRTVADEADLILQNRYFEENPALSDDGAALIARPGMRYLLNVGAGPVRGIASEPGAFNGDLFVVSNDSLYRVTKNKVVTLLQTGLYNPDKGFVKMCLTSPVGAIPNRLFVADGRNLWVYDGSTTSAISTPNDVGIIDCAVSKSYVILIPTQGQGINGRFFWLKPGSIVINPLDFATAESSPDALLGVTVLGDNFCLAGESTTEFWYVTGDLTYPMKPISGVVYERGTWEASAVGLTESLILCDANGGVFQIQGGSPKRISPPNIEETIRKAINLQQKFLG